jgi:hypothetical protein
VMCVGSNEVMSVSDSEELLRSTHERHGEQR